MTTVKRVIAVAVGTIVMCAPVAHADPDNPADQQAFFKSVNGQGVTGNQDSMLRLGRIVCKVQNSGMDPGEIEQYLRTQAHITTDIAQVIRIAAELYLC